MPNNIETNTWQQLLNAGILVTLPLALDCARKGDVPSMLKLMQCLKDHPQKDEMLQHSGVNIEVNAINSSGNRSELMNADLFLMVAHTIKNANSHWLVCYHNYDLSQQDKELLSLAFEVFGPVNQHRFIQAIATNINSRDVIQVLEENSVDMRLLMEVIDAPAIEYAKVAGKNMLEERTPYEIAALCGNLATFNAMDKCLTGKYHSPIFDSDLNSIRSRLFITMETGVTGDVPVALDITEMIAHFSDMKNHQSNTQFAEFKEAIANITYNSNDNNVYLHFVKMGDYISEFKILKSLQIFEEAFLPDSAAEQKKIQRIFAAKADNADLRDTLISTLRKNSCAFLKMLGSELTKDIFEVLKKNDIHERFALHLFYNGLVTGEKRSTRFLECSEFLKPLGFDPAVIVQGKPDESGHVRVPSNTGLTEARLSLKINKSIEEDFRKFVIDITPHGYVPDFKNAKGESELDSMSENEKDVYEAMLRSITAKDVASELLGEFGIDTVSAAKPR